MDLSVLGGNITQTLFKQNEQLVVPSDSVSTAFQSLSSLSGINSMPQEINNIQSQLPAYISQAHLSTWYQDNPWPTLTYNKKYGVPPMGGSIDPDLPPGYKPNNTYNNYLRTNNNMLPKPQSILVGMNKTQLMRENFGNVEIKIHWQ
jgi:hypothetical protein